MGKIKVLFVGERDEEHRQYILHKLQAINTIQVFFSDKVDDPGTYALAEDADVLVAGHPSKELIGSARNLKLHIVPFTGVQHVIDLFKGRRITLTNAHWPARSVAQHVLALLLALVNRIVPHHIRMVEGQWRVFEDGLATIPLHGRKVGLLGYGAVNRHVHELMRGFDVEFAILKRSPGPAQKSPSSLPTPVKWFTADQLHPFLSLIDTLLIALPLSKHTEGIIKMPELELLGKDGLLVNVARGALLNEHDLFTALERRVIAGAALDVWYDYRPEPDEAGRKYPYARSHPFHALGNVVLSPHRAASPIRTLERWDEVIENIRRFAQGEELINVVDLEQGY